MTRRPRSLFALLALLAFVWLPPDASAGSIRVALIEGAETLEVSGAPIRVSDQAGRQAVTLQRSPIKIIPLRSDLEVGGTRFPVPVVRIEPVGSSTFKIGGREYRGSFEIWRQGNTLVLVNELPFEEYLVGALRGEVPEKWPMEVLRAQAIVTRTYAAYHRQLNHAKPYHVVATTAHQLFLGRVDPSSPHWSAVRDTAGAVLTWSGRLFPSFYHAESGGRTEQPQAVFSGWLPSLPGIRDEFSGSGPHVKWSMELRLDSLRDLLKKNGLVTGSITGIEVAERSPSLRVAKLAILHTGGQTLVSGNDFRRMVGYETLKSTLFGVAVDGEVARFEGRGYGHGVGFSQWGAKEMAERGYTVRQILEYYYPGTQLTTLK
ncbi:MAG TPA: SpoIID/LytB domain-containing protein [Methylomirabilota bacterium]|nr:SpoIID/LytB domain-containing protein [Methylomirabilota bacterium]